MFCFSGYYNNKTEFILSKSDVWRSVNIFICFFCCFFPLIKNNTGLILILRKKYNIKY